MTAQYAHAAALLDRIAQFASVAAANVAALDGATAEWPVVIPEAEELVRATSRCWRRCAPCSVATRSCCVTRYVWLS